MELIKEEEKVLWIKEGRKLCTGVCILAYSLSKDYAWAEAGGKVKVYLDCDFLPEDSTPYR